MWMKMCEWVRMESCLLKSKAHSNVLYLVLFYIYINVVLKSERPAASFIGAGIPQNLSLPDKYVVERN